MSEIAIVLDNVRSAYNVGSIFRTGDSTGVKFIATCGISPDYTNAKVAKTALGAEQYISSKHYSMKDGQLYINSRQYPTIEAIEELKNNGYYIIGVEQSSNSVNPYNLSKENFNGTDKIAFVLGHEVDGVHSDVLANCDMIIELPMDGMKESLNVCVTAGIVLYHFRNVLTK